jgi:hypothetical protein
MRATTGDRFAAIWFRTWQWVFVGAIAASLLTVALGFVLQVQVMGLLTLGGAVAGVIVSRLGLAGVRRAAHIAPDAVRAHARRLRREPALQPAIVRDPAAPHAGIGALRPQAQLRPRTVHWPARAPAAHEA